MRYMVWPKRIQFIPPPDYPFKLDENGKIIKSGNTCASAIVAFVPDDIHLEDIAGEPWQRASRRASL
jgi:hypothetical protein